MASQKTHALSFGTNVGDYEKGRPGYPDAAVDWILARASRERSAADSPPDETALDDTAPAQARADEPDPAPLDVVDVGAGTGKFTASLVARNLGVTAVEPDPVMRQSLSAAYPGVAALAGSAESLPVPDASADLVTFAQAWHWVDVPQASAEAARILRPGGTLALIWNMRDDRVDWVARLGDIMGSSGAEDYDTLGPLIAAPLSATERKTFWWENPLTREQLLAMITSRSYIIALEPDARTELLRRVDVLLAEHPQLAGRTSYLMPYETRVTLARRRAATAEPEPIAHADGE